MRARSVIGMPGLRRALAGLVALLFATAPTMGHVLMTAGHGADVPARVVSAASSVDASSAHMPVPGCVPGGLVSCAICGLVCHVAVALPQAADTSVVQQFRPRGLSRSDIPDGLPPDAPPRPPKTTAQL